MGYTRQGNSDYDEGQGSSARPRYPKAQNNEEAAGPSYGTRERGKQPPLDFQKEAGAGSAKGRGGSGVNKVVLIGNVGGDPELRHTGNGNPVGNFSLATSDSWVSKDGERQEKTEWHKIIVWGKLAEICGEYLSKGRQVYVEGSIGTRSYEDSEGVKKYITEITAKEVKFLGSKKDDSVNGAPF